jgi:enoyl-CoA hydratase/carnithine racemase
LFKETTPFVTEITLNLEKKLNSLSLNMLYLLIDKLIEWRDNKVRAPRAVFLTGAGTKSYCVGGDLV